jgi:hypothetical protein
MDSSAVNSSLDPRSDSGLGDSGPAGLQLEGDTSSSKKSFTSFAVVLICSFPGRPEALDNPLRSGEDHQHFSVDFGGGPAPVLGSESNYESQIRKLLNFPDTDSDSTVDMNLPAPIMGELVPIRPQPDPPSPYIPEEGPGRAALCDRDSDQETGNLEPCSSSNSCSSSESELERVTLVTVTSHKRKIKTWWRYSDSEGKGGKRKSESESGKERKSESGSGKEKEKRKKKKTKKKVQQK